MGLIDRALDATVLASFDRSGFQRHARSFDSKDLDIDLSGKTLLVTGANSGIGRATATALARLGGRVGLLCRDPARGEEACATIRAETGNQAVFFERLDVSDLRDVARLAAALAGPVDVLVHNAGVLPDARQHTPQGLELTLATNLVGPFLLSQRLLPRLRASVDGRIVFVASGGMYTQRLDVAALAGEDGAFDGTVQYARTKRAEVALTRLLQERVGGAGLSVHAMHPGWADTPAVRSSLPRFYKLTRGILRSAEQGADTVVWLAAADRPRQSPGRFWFDRAEVSPYLLPGTREDEAERARLWEALERWSTR